MVGYVIDYFSIGAQSEHKAKIIMYATIIAAITAMNGIWHHTVGYNLELLGLKLRTAVSSLIYEKASFALFSIFPRLISVSISGNALSSFTKSILCNFIIYFIILAMF